MLEKLAAMAPPQSARAETGQTGDFNLERWIAQNQLPVVAAGPWRDGRKWILNPCPFNSEHNNGAAFVVQFPIGAIAAACNHNGCVGKG